MIYYSLFVHTKSRKNDFDRDFLTFERENFIDCYYLILFLYRYPAFVTRIRLVQYSCNENIDEAFVELNSFKVTFPGNDLFNKPIFTLEKD